MNGDGIQDLVKIRRGRVLYWPGRGVGVEFLWWDDEASAERRALADHLRSLA